MTYPDEIAIQANNLSRAFGSTSGVQDVSFTVLRGKILGFIGLSGSGKTTTARLISWAIPATYGILMLRGALLDLELFWRLVVISFALTCALNIWGVAKMNVTTQATFQISPQEIGD